MAKSTCHGTRLIPPKYSSGNSDSPSPWGQRKCCWMMTCWSATRSILLSKSATCPEYTFFFAGHRPGPPAHRPGPPAHRPTGLPSKQHVDTMKKVDTDSTFHSKTILFRPHHPLQSNALIVVFGQPTPTKQYVDSTEIIFSYKSILWYCGESWPPGNLCLVKLTFLQPPLPYKAIRW